MARTKERARRDGPPSRRLAVTQAAPAGPAAAAAAAAAPSAAAAAETKEVAETSTAAPAPDQRLVALRAEMAKADGGAGVDAYIVPSEDPHMSEYAPEFQARREFLTHFTGSAGTAVVTTDAACLWTDGRYFLQAEQQLPAGWTLMRVGTPKCPEIADWLAETLPEGGRVGIDPFLHTMDSARSLKTKLEEAGRVLVPLLGGNLVDAVWGDARPAPPAAPVRVHPLEHAGESVADKLARMRKEVEKAKAGALLVTALDEVAWLLNLRGADVSYNPVFMSYALLTADTAALYIDAAKVSPEARAHLTEAGVEVKPYDALLADVRALAAAGTPMLADPAKVSYAISTAAQEAVQAAAGPADGPGRKRARTTNGKEPQAAAPAPARKGKVFVEKASPVSAAKALKNAAELAGMREAHLRDAVALAGTFSWLERQVAGGRQLSEVEVDEELTGRRAAQPGFIEPSFPTIAGAGPNGAIIHYRAQPDTCGQVGPDTLLLVDSGGQYDCGTTDVTRTMHMGTPTAHQKDCFTRVLQGHIALDTAVFPEGTPGLALDAFARSALWRAGLNYRHGTGHGVGAALNVHEGPMSISTRYNNTTPLAAGMVVSNEPGYYEDGAFGIRVENLVTIVTADTPHRFGDQPYFRFEALTLCPLQRKLMALEDMTDAEVAWVDDYHARVWQEVSPRLQGDAETLEWLRVNTQPLRG